jgi:hypothetical protein
MDLLVAPAENSNVVTLGNTDVPCAYVGAHPSPVVSLIWENGFVPFEAVSRGFYCWCSRGRLPIYLI